MANRYTRAEARSVSFHFKRAMEAEQIRLAIENGVPVPSEPWRYQIFLPEIFSLSENFEQSNQCLNLIREMGLNARYPILLRLENLKSIDPTAALVLVAEIYRCRHLRAHRSGTFITGTYPRDLPICRSLANMGFFQLLKVSPKDDPEQDVSEDLLPIYLKFHTANQILSPLVQGFVSVIERHVIKLDEVARGRLIGAIIEAMSNSWEHAYSKTTPCQSMRRRWWLGCEVRLAEHETTVMLCDQGVGISATLEPTRWEAFKRSSGLTFLGASEVDGYMIKAATELYRTGTGQASRGRGFRDMKRFVDLCSEGRLRILSNKGWYT